MWFKNGTTSKYDIVNKKCFTINKIEDTKIIEKILTYNQYIYIYIKVIALKPKLSHNSTFYEPLKCYIF